MHEPRAFAYTLSQVETGWCWNVLDEDGVTVGGGVHVSRAQAQAAVERILKPGDAEDCAAA